MKKIQVALLFISLIFSQSAFDKYINSKHIKNKYQPYIEKKNSEPNKSKKYNVSLECSTDICLELKNHNKKNKSFDIFMINKEPVAGFQCDFLGINLNLSNGGLLEKYKYQTSNSIERLLSFSMEAILIPEGEAVLTNISYTNFVDSICMDKIIFSGKYGKRLSTNQPECIK